MKNKKNLYDVLGVDKTATQSEIKKAFRDKAKKVHTDKGGEKEEMQELNKAYAVLKIESKREHYDRTGEDTDTPFDKKFHAFIQQVFVNVIINNERNIESSDLIKNFKNYIDDLITQNDDARAQLSKEIKKIEQVILRLKSKKDNVISIVLQQNIDVQKNNFNQLQDANVFLKEAHTHLKDYYYEFTKPQEINHNRGPKFNHFNAHTGDAFDSFFKTRR